MATSNPIFSNFVGLEVSRKNETAGSGTMSLSGVLQKTAILLMLFAATVACSWIGLGSFPRGNRNATLVLALILFVCTLADMALVWVTVLMKEWAPFTAPVYAVVQGVVVGFIVAGMEQRFPGIAIKAVGFTVAICLCLMVAYRTGLIRVTESFNKKLVFATGGVLIYYIASITFALRGGHTFSRITGGIPGVVISLIIILIAGMSLVSNFDFAVQRSKENFPKYMEWYSALGLLLTLVWLYLEALKLFSKARK